MKASKVPSSAESYSWETNPEAWESIEAVQLRLLMKEREEAVTKLVELDYTIWVLEEFFRRSG